MLPSIVKLTINTGNTARVIALQNGSECLEETCVSILCVIHLIIIHDLLYLFGILYSFIGSKQAF